MLKFKSHKVVEAGRIVGVDLTTTSITIEGGETVELSHATIERIITMARESGEGAIIGGYFVRYEDGYQSWSPAKTFEEGYTPIQPDSDK